MGIFDKAKKLVDEHADQVDKAIDKATEAVNKKTAGKYDEQVAKASEFLKDKTGDSTGGTGGPQHPTG